jgi:hypothetical protein
METLSPEVSRWTSAEKISFRFLFVFFLLFIIVENNGAFPFFENVMEYPTLGLHAFVVWLGKNVLHLPYDIVHFTYGSGDTTYDYILVLCCFVIAITSTITWSIVDKRSDGYPKLYYWLTVIIRFYVGLMLINYGMVKIFKLQFPYPYLYRLLQPYGDSSPMGLAWTFLGFSKGYNYFMGVAEVAAGLLLFRRTTTFGAMISMFTAANVMAINYFYDVPVKILSTSLFLFSFFLLSKDIRRIAIFFFSGKSIDLPVIQYPYTGNRKMNIARIAIKIMIISYVMIMGVVQGIESEKMYGDKAPRTKLYGIYNVDTFVLGKDTLPPLMTDTLRWKKLAVNSLTQARIYHVNDSIGRYFTKFDTVQHTLTLKLATDTTFQYHLSYNQLDSVNFVFRGTVRNDSMVVTLKKIKFKPEDFRLMGRGFHWINETPYNR